MLRYSKRVVAACLTLSLVATLCWAENSPTPFMPGERLSFELKWGLIPAGEATLELLPVEMRDNQPVYHFVLTVKTNAFIDLFYTYRSRIDAYVDMGMKRSFDYREQTRKNRMSKEVVIEFDWLSNQARYKQRLESVYEADAANRTTARVTPLLPGALDPLSAFYYARMQDLKVGIRIEHPVSDGIKCRVAHAEVIKKESIFINGKAYDTLLIQPDFRGVQPVFELLGGAGIQVWVTADARRVPVKVASRIALGQFTGELTSATNAVGVGAETTER